MGRVKTDFRAYIRCFPSRSRTALSGKLAFKSLLETDKRLRIPERVWLAFLTPPSKDSSKYMPSSRQNIWKLKQEMLKTFEHPREFIHMRDPLHRSRECVTLALLEILYDLKENKVLLKEEGYQDWLDIANHFGSWRLRYMLEDAVFKTFDPENFSLFESVVAKQLFLDAHLVQAIHAIVKDAFTRAGIKKFSIVNRTKNICGVYKKVALKGKSVNDVYDIHGFRILTSSKADCFKAVETLHRLWPCFPERYKDYISTPKENGYQSIHTVVHSLEGKSIEFQIRTREMDVVAASGPASHAEYKNGSKKVTSRELARSS